MMMISVLPTIILTYQTREYIKDKNLRKYHRKNIIVVMCDAMVFSVNWVASCVDDKKIRKE